MSEPSSRRPHGTVHSLPASLPPVALPGLRIELLGTFRVVVNGRVVADEAWRLRKARALVKLLALAPGHRLEREQLFEVLWPDLAPAAAANNLSNALHVARRALAGEGSPPPLPGQGTALALVAAVPLWIDAVAFEAAAATALRTGNLADYQAALDLYGGELLPEDRYEDWAVLPREQLRQIHLTILRDVATWHEARGGWSAAIATLQRLVRAEPTDEGAHQGLMRLFALAGQRGQALRQWEHYTATLRRELDTTPDAAGQQLHGEIAAGRFPPPVPGASAVPPPAPGRPRAMLPVPPTPLVGRDAELAAIKAALAGGRLLTLTGVGGAGKSRLALAAATELSARYPDGTWFVELAALADPTLVPGTVARAVLGGDRPSRDPLAALVDALRDATALLVLDNCEHLREDCAALARQLLATCPRLRLIATSRELLGLSSEHVWPVPPLRLPAIDPTGRYAPARLAEMESIPAVRLLVDRLRQRRPGFVLASGNSAAVIEICHRLGGIPLALELAAARASALTVGEIAALLDNALPLLVTRDQTAPPRQQTLTAALDWSHALLTPIEQRLFRRLAVFAGGWTLAAAEHVCAGAEETSVPGSVLDLLTGLVERSLVLAEEHDGTSRYRLLEPVRQYAAAHLATSQETGHLHARHADYYQELADHGEERLTGANQAAQIALLIEEHENIRAALTWLLDQGAIERGLRLTRELWRFWTSQGEQAEGWRWLTAFLDQDTPDDTDQLALVRTRACFAAGRMALERGDLGMAGDLGRRALHWARVCNDTGDVAAASTLLGHVARRRGEYDTARALYTEALAIRRGNGLPRYIAVSLQSLGNLALTRDEYGEARTFLTEALDLLRRVEDHGEGANVCVALGQVARAEGDDRAAVAWFEEALRGYRAGNFPARTVHVLLELAELVALGGDVFRARGLIAEGLALARQGGARQEAAAVLEALATVAAVEGEAALALRLHGAADAHHASRGEVLPPVRLQQLWRALAPARAALGEEPGAAARSAGERLTLDAALAEARAAGLLNTD